MQLTLEDVTLHTSGNMFDRLSAGFVGVSPGVPVAQQSSPRCADVSYGTQSCFLPQCTVRLSGVLSSILLRTAVRLERRTT